MSNRIDVAEGPPASDDGLSLSMKAGLAVLMLVVIITAWLALS